MTGEDWEEKIRALIAKAESTEFEAERDLFMAKAQELMVKYRIDPERLARAKAEGVALTYHWVVYSTSDSNRVGWALLLDKVAKANGVVCVVEPWSHTGKRGGERRARLVGFAEEVKAVELLFTSLKRQAYLSCARAYARYPGGAGKSAFMTNFLVGFGHGVQERFEAATARAAGDMLPVLASQYDKVREEARKSLGFKTAAVKSSYDGAARQAGTVAGRNADIGQKCIRG